MNSPYEREDAPLQDVPGLDGPDYVALVIEWEDDDVTIVRDRDAHRPVPVRTIAAAVGALAALVFATWGIRRLRAS